MREPVIALRSATRWTEVGRSEGALLTLRLAAPLSPAGAEALREEAALHGATPSPRVLELRGVAIEEKRLLMRIEAPAVGACRLDEWLVQEPRGPSELAGVLIEVAALLRLWAQLPDLSGDPRQPLALPPAGFLIEPGMPVRAIFPALPLLDRALLPESSAATDPLDAAIALCRAVGVMAHARAAALITASETAPLFGQASELVEAVSRALGSPAPRAERLAGRDPRRPGVDLLAFRPPARELPARIDGLPLEDWLEPGIVVAAPAAKSASASAARDDARARLFEDLGETPASRPKSAPDDALAIRFDDPVDPSAPRAKASDNALALLFDDPDEPASIPISSGDARAMSFSTGAPASELGALIAHTLAETPGGNTVPGEAPIELALDPVKANARYLRKPAARPSTQPPSEPGAEDEVLRLAFHEQQATEVARSKAPGAYSNDHPPSADPDAALRDEASPRSVSPSAHAAGNTHDETSARAARRAPRAFAVDDLTLETPGPAPAPASAAAPIPAAVLADDLLDPAPPRAGSDADPPAYARLAEPSPAEAPRAERLEEPLRLVLPHPEAQPADGSSARWSVPVPTPPAPAPKRRWGPIGVALALVLGGAFWALYPQEPPRLLERERGRATTRRLTAGRGERPPSERKIATPRREQTQPSETQHLETGIESAGPPPGEPTELDRQRARESGGGFLMLSSAPSGARVLLNGQYAGETPLSDRHDFTPGARVVVQVSREGYRDLSETVVVEPNGLLRLSVELTLTPAAAAERERDRRSRFRRRDESP